MEDMAGSIDLHTGHTCPDTRRPAACKVKLALIVVYRYPSGRIAVTVCKTSDGFFHTFVADSDNFQVVRVGIPFVYRQQSQRHGLLHSKRFAKPAVLHCPIHGYFTVSSSRELLV
eukprot:GHUV01040790.1.p1 GENE.GHUV01040790.1~~GHUV01040790.1.p1  ORF type:complete len:115 (-),score=23.51 GHUV01040790.1:243-587(-)